MTDKTDSKPEAKKASTPAPKAQTVRVICMARGGRRRGGRAWPEGETLVPAEEMTPALRKALKGDAMFQVAD